MDWTLVWSVVAMAAVAGGALYLLRRHRDRFFPGARDRRR